MHLTELLPQLKLIVGLGNVGKDYENTRHNAGFICVDAWREKLNGSNWKEDKNLKAYLSELVTENRKLLLAKPITLMNNSGQAVRAISDYYHIEPQEILVIHDDLDIALGSFKLQQGRGPKVHNGIDSVNQYLGTEDYWRLRVGIENRTELGNKSVPGMRYALERFKSEELEIIEKTCLSLVTSFQ